MPRPRPPYLHRETSRHGSAVWYVRKGDGPRIRIRGTFGTPEFMAAYTAAVSGGTPAPARKAAAGTLGWLIERYRETTAWTDLSKATRRQRENIFKQVIATAGAESCRAIGRKTIAAGRDRRSGTPAQARNFLDAMRGLFRWAAAAEHVAADPTDGVKNPKRKDEGGFPAWNEDDVAAFQKRWPLGTKERVWLDVLLYTGLRRGDAVRIGKQHVRDGIATIRTEKTGADVALPILPVLQATLDAGPTGDLAFICGERGQPLTKESFGNAFRAACRAAGVDKSAHGVRKIGATRAADNGASESQLEAIFGWSGGQMASLYTRAANRRRLAKEAMGMMNANAPGTSYPRTLAEGAGISAKSADNSKD